MSRRRSLSAPQLLVPSSSLCVSRPCVRAACVPYSCHDLCASIACCCRRRRLQHTRRPDPLSKGKGDLLHILPSADIFSLFHAPSLFLSPSNCRLLPLPRVCRPCLPEERRTLSLSLSRKANGEASGREMVLLRDMFFVHCFPAARLASDMSA